MKKTLLACSLTALLTTTAQADWTETLGDLWKSTKEISSDAYESSKEYTNKAIDKSKDYYDDFSAESITASQLTPQHIQQEKKQHIKTVWKDILADLDTALDLNTQIDKAPASRFFGSDKKSLGKEQIDVFEQIEALLSSPAINKNRQAIESLKDRIRSKQDDIAEYLEQRIVADNDERAKYDKKIQQTRADIAELNRRIQNEKNKLKKRFNASGLLLSDPQIDVLLSRVDADDIIKMSLVYDVLADITTQLMGLTKESNENINQARKYYGMHVVLLKLVLNMQGSYIKKLDNEYLPKIDNIRKDTHRINQESSRLLSSERDAQRRSLLQKNIKAQQLTLKVARLYAQQLNQQKAKVIKSRKLITDDYRVAKNTYDTVKISADLIRLMNTNRASFSALMNIQVPEIVPFENLEMQRKFEELSSLIK